MATTIEIFPTSGAWTDYSTWLWGGDADLMVRVHALNNPQTLSWAFENGDAGFTALVAGNRVRVTTASYGVWFVGYLRFTPKLELLGADKNGNSVYGYRCNAVSEELRLEWGASARFGTLPPFANKNQGQIIKELITILGGGFDVTNVDNGIFIPLFRTRPDESFFDAVRRLVDKTNMKFWTKNGFAWFKSFSDAAFGYSPDEADLATKFDPYSIDISPLADPVFNDVIGVGQIEPQVYAKEYFVGDGVTATFILKLPLYGGTSSKLLEDDFSAAAIDANRWVETDPNSLITPSGGGLVFSATAPAGASRLTSKQGLEIAGALELCAGRIKFNGASDLIIGGGFSSDTGALAQCVAGFRATPSGGQTQLQSIVSGSVAGPTYVTVAGKTYQFLLSIDSSVLSRQQQVFDSLANSYGGAAIAANADVSFQVIEIPDSVSDAPTVVLSYTTVISNIAGFLFYTVMAGPLNLANNVNLVLNLTSLRKAIYAEAWSKLKGASAWSRILLGDKADPIARAAITVQTEGHALEFFPNLAPVELEKIKVIYRGAGIARARVKLSSSITTEATKAGDSGSRTTNLPTTNPPPQNSAELELAIQAFINDHTSAYYQGNWTFDCKSYPPGIEPIPGRFMTVNATSRYPSFSALVTQVESHFQKLNPDATEIIDHKVTFGSPSQFELIQRDFAPPDEALQGALDTLVDLTPVEFASVGTNFAADRPDAEFDDTITATTIEIDTKTAPTSSYEVRKTNLLWGSGSTINQISTPATQTFTVSRNSADLALYLKNKDGSANFSRYATMIRVVYPLPPSQPSVSSDISDALNPVIIIDSALLNDANVYGVEIRDSGNVTVKYTVKSIVLAPSDLSWTFLNNASRSIDFHVYAFNLLSEYSTDTHYTLTIPTPSLSALAINETTGSLNWTGANATSFLVEIATDAGYTAIILSKNVSAETVMLDDENILRQRYFRVTPKDALGSGTPVTASHAHTPAGVWQWDNTNELWSVASMPTPNTDITVPGPFSKWDKELIDSARAQRILQNTRI